MDIEELEQAIEELESVETDGMTSEEWIFYRIKVLELLLRVQVDRVTGINYRLKKIEQWIDGEETKKTEQNEHR